MFLRGPNTGSRQSGYGRRHSRGTQRRSLACKTTAVFALNSQHQNVIATAVFLVAILVSVTFLRVKHGKREPRGQPSDRGAHKLYLPTIVRGPSTAGHHRLRLALVINLARRQDRWQRMYRHLRTSRELINYAIERLEAVDGQQSLDFAQMVVNGTLRQRAFESVMSQRRRIWGQELTAGAVGCLFSHAKAWERALNLNESVLVLEDDVELLSPAFDALFSRALKQLPANFGLLYLGDMAKDNETIRKTTYSANLMRLSRPLWGTYAYVVSPLAARRLLLHMYPADVQVDSYIKQVADLYDAEMPNFVVAQDIVYTDNSETRDTDAQARGVDGGTESPKDAVKDEQLRYHVLLPPSGTGSSGRTPGARHLLQFDASYSASSSAPPQGSYHNEQAALAYADDLGILGSPAQEATAVAAASEIEILRAQHKQAWRWLLCVAVSMRHGGLCFTEPFTIVRSIQHLLYQVSFGVFLASSTSSADERPKIMSQVVYASPRSMPPSAFNNLKWALGDAVAKTTAPTAGNQDRRLDFFELIQLALSKHTTKFPPHIFDPLLPLQRPCHCSLSLVVRHRNDEEDHGCRSRCKRLVAPPFAAGFQSLREANVSSLRHVTPLTLHVIMPSSGEPGITKDVAQKNLRLWKRMHAPPQWIVKDLESDTRKQHRPVANACMGISAVAKNGGVYVDSQSSPRQSLLSGVLRDWSAMDACVHSRRCHQRAPVVVVALSQAHSTRVRESTAPTTDGNYDRRPFGALASPEQPAGAVMRKQLSMRFFAALAPNNPLAKRLASACENALSRLRGCGEYDCNHSAMFISLQLQQALADDAWSVGFVREDDVFE